MSLGEILEHGTKRLAMDAPFGVEIDEHGLFAFQHPLIKCRGGYLLQPRLRACDPGKNCELRQPAASNASTKRAAQNAVRQGESHFFSWQAVFLE